jgi:hypothetical protein
VKDYPVLYNAFSNYDWSWSVDAAVDRLNVVVSQDLAGPFGHIKKNNILLSFPEN